MSRISGLAIATALLVLGGLYLRWAFTVDLYEVNVVTFSALGAALATAAVVGVAGTVVIRRRDRQAEAQAENDAEAHLAPLKTGGAVEDTLTGHLEGLGHLLRPRPLSYQRATVLAGRVYRRTLRRRGERQDSRSAPAPRSRPGGRHAAPRRPAPVSRPVPVAVVALEALPAGGPVAAGVPSPYTDAEIEEGQQFWGEHWGDPGEPGGSDDPRMAGRAPIASPPETGYAKDDTGWINLRDAVLEGGNA